MLEAPFVQMMTMYDYGCEKHYNRPVPAHSAVMGRKDMDEQKQKIARALDRVGGK